MARGAECVADVCAACVGVDSARIANRKYGDTHTSWTLSLMLLGRHACELTPKFELGAWARLHRHNHRCIHRADLTFSESNERNRSLRMHQ